VTLKILIIDIESGQGLDYALECQAFGHEVKLWINSFPGGERRTVGDGMVPRVSDYHPWLKWADLIFPTGNAALMKERDKLIEQGFPIFGSGTQGCKLELDRVFAMKLLERHGVELIPYHEFPNLVAAGKFLKDNGGMWVIKPADGGNPDKSLTFVPSNEDYAEEEIQNTLEKWVALGKGGMAVVLQEFKPGIEVGVSCFFGPGGWSKWKNTCFEHKKLQSRNFGPNCGEAGTIVQYSEHSRIFDELLAPFTEYLHSAGYVGDVAVNCIMDKKTGALGFLELTCRAGWPHWNLVRETHKGDPAQWALDLVNGKDTLEVSTDVCCGLVMTIPNFPFTVARNRAAEGIVIFGVTEKNAEHIHFCEVRKNRKGQIETAGEYTCVISGKGKTVVEATKKAYDIAEYLVLPNKMCRDDVGEKLEHQLPFLHKFDIATDMEFE
jgi:phosphoribosylamine--glycine ligase